MLLSSIIFYFRDFIAYEGLKLLLLLNNYKLLSIRLGATTVSIRIFICITTFQNAL